MQFFRFMPFHPCLMEDRQNFNEVQQILTNFQTGRSEVVPIQYWRRVGSHPVLARSMKSWNPVYALVKKIPRGRAATYGQIAAKLKLPGGARTAGRAMAACPSGKGIPWHRVVGAGGRLLVHDPAASLQRKLLEAEGVQVLEKRIANFASYQWQSGKRVPRRAKSGSARGAAASAGRK
jgi:methylated-DNA-protein-cysteine methyltransferase-like protein